MFMCVCGGHRSKHIIMWLCLSSHPPPQKKTGFLEAVLELAQDQADLELTKIYLLSAPRPPSSFFFLDTISVGCANGVVTVAKGWIGLSSELVALPLWEICLSGEPRDCLCADSGYGLDHTKLSALTFHLKVRWRHTPIPDPGVGWRGQFWCSIDMHEGFLLESWRAALGDQPQLDLGPGEQIFISVYLSLPPLGKLETQHCKCPQHHVFGLLGLLFEQAGKGHPDGHRASRGTQGLSRGGLEKVSPFRLRAVFVAVMGLLI